MIPLKDGGSVRGARSGGITAHLSGPHLIPNVGREAMLGAEVVRRKPKAKAKYQPKPEKLPPPQTKKAEVVKRRRSPLRDRSHQRRSRSRGSPSQSRGQSRAAGRSAESIHHRNDEHERSRSPPSASRQQAADVDDPIWRQQQAEAQEREERRLMEERRQLQMLEEEKKRKQRQTVERNKKLAGFFSLTEDDLEEEIKPPPVDPTKERFPAQAALSAALEGRHSLSSSGSRPSSVREDFEESAGNSGFDKCWGKWDWNKKDDPGELARQFMKVTAAKRRGYAPQDKGGRSSRPARGRSSSSSRGRAR